MRIDITFIATGLIFLLIGLVFGVWMGVSNNLQFASVHAHWNLLGFVAGALYGLIHRAYPKLRESRLAWPQFFIHYAGVLVFAPGFMLAITTDNPTVAIIGAVLVILATLTFTWMFISRAKALAAQ